MQYMADQTVARDYKLIKQSDFVVVYYPTTVLSAGVISEMIYAVANGKQVFAVWLPPTEPSPFFSYYCTAPVFRSIGGPLRLLRAHRLGPRRHSATDSTMIDSNGRPRRATVVMRHGGDGGESNAPSNTG